MRTCLLCEATSAGTAVTFRGSSKICEWCRSELARTGQFWCSRGLHKVAALATGKRWCKACERVRMAPYEESRPGYAREWRLRNHAHAIAYGAAYRDANREKLNQRAYERYWSNPDYYRAQSRISHARRRVAAQQYARWYYWQRPEQMRVDARHRAVRRKLAILRGMR